MRTTYLVNLDHPQQDINRPRERNKRRLRYQLALELLPKPDANSTSRLLEIGGGAGEFGEMADRLGYDISFVDANPHNIHLAKKYGWHTYRIDLNLGLPGIQDHYYDLAVILDVIEHIVRAENLIREIARVLKKDGRLLASTPNFAYFIWRWRALTGAPPLDEGYHYRFFTKHSFCDLLNQNGFTITKANYVTYAHGLNFVRRRLGKGAVYWRVPENMANLLAQNLVVLARKGTDN